MRKVILIYGNCVNPYANADFTFAAMMAKDLQEEMKNNENYKDVGVVLTTTLESIGKFRSLYPKITDDLLIIEGQEISLCALELFDGAANQVLAFIEANHCKYPAENLLKNVLSPTSKLLIIGTPKHPVVNSFMDKLMRINKYAIQQPGIYEYFNKDDILLGASGFEDNRLGLPKILKAEQLPQLSFEQLQKIPKRNYGFVYINTNEDGYGMLICQYIALSRCPEYVLVGNLSNSDLNEIELFVKFQWIINSNFSYQSPQINHYKSLDNCSMRRIASASSSPLTLATGTMSTIEAMWDGKLTYYQDLENNQQFVISYLKAVQLYCKSNDSLVGAKLIIELSALLFADKPLSIAKMKRADELLRLQTISSELVDINKKIIEKANNQLAPRLLSFIGRPSSMSSQVQYNTACNNLRKPGETTIPTYDQALRRAAAFGRLFELKIIIKAMAPADLGKRDNRKLKFSALHWAVVKKNTKCVEALIDQLNYHGIDKANFLDVRDANGKTPLHHAVKNNDQHLIKLLVKAGASSEIEDNGGKKTL